MKWFKNWNEQRSTPLSHMLLKYTGKVVFREILSITPDRRDLLQSVAECIELDERLLLEKLSRRWCFRVAPRVITTELEHAPAASSLQVMRREGFIAIYRDGMFRGVICSDPSQIPKIFMKLDGFQYLVAPWREISVALDRSEERYHSLRSSQEASGPQSNTSEVSQLTREVLSELVLRAKGHGASSLELSLNAEGLSYLFPLPNGKNGCGTVHKSMTKPLLLLLLELTKATRDSGYSVTTLERLQRYRIAWQEENQETVIPRLEEVSPVQKESFTEEVGIADTDRNDDKALEDEYTSSILVIDDSDVFGSVVERFLLREGLTVERRLSSKQALEEVRRGILKPQVILCDLHMPEMNGMQFLTEMKITKSNQHISIFMLSSDEEVLNEIEAIEKGALGFLRKTDDPRVLVAHMKRVIGQQDRYSEAA
ncbi:MAG: response regulator [Bdellovibrionota bacterium]